MAQTKTSRPFGTVAFALVCAAVTYTPTASAQDSATVEFERAVITDEMKQTELRELREARVAAGAYARSCASCVGIVFSEGDDLRATVHSDALSYLEQRGAPQTEHNIAVISEQITELYVQHYADKFSGLFEAVGVETEMFSRVDYGNAQTAVGTGVDFHIGRILYHDVMDNDRTSFFVEDVDAIMALNVVEALATVWANDPELN